MGLGELISLVLKFFTNLGLHGCWSLLLEEWRPNCTSSMGFLCPDPDVEPDADLPITYAAYLSSRDNQIYQYLNQDRIFAKEGL